MRVTAPSPASTKESNKCPITTQRSRVLGPSEKRIGTLQPDRIRPELGEGGGFVSETRVGVVQGSIPVPENSGWERSPMVVERAGRHGPGYLEHTLSLSVCLSLSVEGFPARPTKERKERRPHVLERLTDGAGASGPPAGALAAFCFCPGSTRRIRAPYTLHTPKGFTKG